MKIDHAEGIGLRVKGELLTQQNSASMQSSLRQETTNPTDTRIKEVLQASIDELNELMQPLHTNVKFRLHEDLQEYYVTVVDSTTYEVIKEIPPRKMLDRYARMAEFMGLLVDEQV